MVGNILPRIFEADIFVAAFSVLAADVTAFVAEKFRLVLLRFGQRFQLVKGFIQPKIGDNIKKIITVGFADKLLKFRQNLCG